MEVKLSRGSNSPNKKIVGRGHEGPTITCVERMMQDLRGTYVIVFHTGEAMGAAQYLTGWSERGPRGLEVPFNGGLIKTNEPGTEPRYYECVDLVEESSRSEFLAATKNAVRATHSLQKAVRALGLKI